MQGVKFKILTCLGTLPVVMIAALSFTCCDNFGGGIPQPSTDSTYIADDSDVPLELAFSSVAEVVSFQKELIKDYEIDETFRSMPFSVITNVATVCLKKSMLVSKTDIIEEYLANRSVYDNLDSTDASQSPQEDKGLPAVEEGQPTPAPLATSYHYEVDTMDGQPVKVLVKEEKYESK